MSNLQRIAKEALDELSVMRDICISEKREPTSAERKRAKELLDVVENNEFFAPKTHPYKPDLQNLGPAYEGRVTYTPRSRPGIPVGGDTAGFDNIGEYFATLVRDPADIRLRRQTVKAMEVGTLSEGGALVPEAFSNQLIGLIVEKSIILSRADVYTMTGAGDVLKIPAIDDINHSVSRGGLVAQWTGEGGTISPDQITTRQLQLVPKKLTLLVKCTREFMQDAVQAQRFVTDTMTGEAAWQLDHAMLRGTGAGQPLGILNAPDLATCPKETSQDPDSITWTNLCSMYQMMVPSGDSSAIWLFSPSLKTSLFTMGVAIGTGGTGMWPALTQATGNISLLGKEVFFTEHLKVAGEKGDALLCNPRALAVALKQQIQIDTSDGPYFLEDSVAFRLTARLDAQSKYSSTLVLNDGTTTTSNFVTLAAR